MFSSSSEVVTFVFLSGLSFQYIHSAAFLTARSKRDSDARVHTSSLFSAVMPSKQRCFSPNTHTNSCTPAHLCSHPISQSRGRSTMNMILQVQDNVHIQHQDRKSVISVTEHGGFCLIRLVRVFHYLLISWDGWDKMVQKAKKETSCEQAV